jgi:Ca2+-binding EF-hand superfamily protein
MTRQPLFFRAFAIGLFIVSPLAAFADSAKLGQENFRQADSDKDGQLVFAEFATFIDLNAADGLGNAEMVSSRGMHARAFRRVDADGDGIVTPEELQAMR